MRWCVFTFCLAVLAGCGEEGRLVIALERPSEKALDPMADVRLAKFGLRVIQGGNTTDQEAFRSDAAELTVGSVPVGTPFDLRLAGKAATGQMLGLGQVFDVSVSGDDTTTVQVKFRKPIGYVVGQPGIDMLDATVTTRESAPLAPMRQITNVSAVAATPDGAWLLVVSGQTMSALLTSNHTKWAEAKIPAGGNCLAVSPDNRYAVVCHKADKSASIVDLAKLAENQSVVRVVKLPSGPTKVVFGQHRGTAMVLVDGVGHLDGCTNNSTLVDIDLQSAVATGSLPLNKPVADVAIDPRDNSLLLALPCERALGRVEANQPKKLPMQVPRHYDLAVTDQFLVLLGSDNATPPRGEAVLFDLNRGGFDNPQVRHFSLPGRGISFNNPGTGTVFVFLDLQTFTIYDVVVSPGGQRAIGLFQAHYVANTNVGTCSVDFDIRAFGYLLVDLTVDTYLFSRSTSLSFNKCSTCDFPAQSSCESWFRTGLQELEALSKPEFDPQGMTLLFGGS